MSDDDDREYEHEHLDERQFVPAVCEAASFCIRQGHADLGGRLLAVAWGVLDVEVDTELAWRVLRVHEKAANAAHGEAHELQQQWHRLLTEAMALEERIQRDLSAQRARYGAIEREDEERRRAKVVEFPRPYADEGEGGGGEPS